MHASRNAPPSRSLFHHRHILKFFTALGATYLPANPVRYVCKGSECFKELQVSLRCLHATHLNNHNSVRRCIEGSSHRRAIRMLVISWRDSAIDDGMGNVPVHTWQAT